MDDLDLSYRPIQPENRSQVLPVVKVKEEDMDVKRFELEDPADLVEVVLRVKEELPDAEDLPYEPLEMEHSTEFVPVLEIKEELPDVKDELIPVHDIEISPAHIMDGRNADNDTIKPEVWSDKDPLSILEKQSGCHSPVIASCDYKTSESPSLKVTKSGLYCKGKTSRIKDFKNSTLYNEGNPAQCFTESGKVRLRKVRHESQKPFSVRCSSVDQSLIKYGERENKCEESGKCFTFRSGLVRHLIIHSGEKKHKCEVCGKCFTRRNTLVRHSLIHSGERKHKCEECGKCFTQRSSFVSHSLIHSGEKKHQCEECGKCFSRRSYLVSHSLIHSGEKKHKCEECCKCFAQRAHLVSHSLIHSGEKKHKCQECGKCFTERSNLVKHSPIHSGEKKHKCEECGKCFTERSNLVKHSLIHSGEKSKNVRNLVNVLGGAVT